MNTLLRATLGFSMLWACQAKFDTLKYCNEGKILWAQMRFYQKEITNRVNKLKKLVEEFSKCRQYKETWMKWPTEGDVNRRHIIYQYQQNSICTENYLDLSRQGLGPSGHAFAYSGKMKGDDKLQIEGVPDFNVAKPDDTVRPVFESSAPRAPKEDFDDGTRRLAYDADHYIQPDTKCIPHACAKLPYVPHDQTTAGYHGNCGGGSVCSQPKDDNGADVELTRDSCESIWDNENEGTETPTYCVWVNDTFSKMEWPDPYGNGKHDGYKPDGKTNADLLNGADYSGSTKRLVATTTGEGLPGNGEGKWAWIGATRFCAATNTLMHWISKQTLDIQESEHFIKQEAWCNVLEESIIHESIKTTEKREMGALLQQQCDEWSKVDKSSMVGKCQEDYACTNVLLTSDGTASGEHVIGPAPEYRVDEYGLPSTTGQLGAHIAGQDSRTTFGNPKFGNRYAVGDVSQTYGNQNIAKMITSPTQVVAWMALKHLGIDTSAEFGDGFEASKSRFERLRDDDAMIAANLMRDLTGSFHYATGAIDGKFNPGNKDNEVTGEYVGGWHYGDRNWNSADKTFTWTDAQKATNSTAPVLWPKYFGKNGASQVSGVLHNGKPLEIGDGLYQNDEHNGVMPWNVGVDGHGTIKHEAILRQDIVNALKEDEKVAKYFSGLISDPDSGALTNAINAVKSDWKKYDLLKTGDNIANNNQTASYAAFSDFTFNFNGETAGDIQNDQAAAAWYKIQNQESNTGDKEGNLKAVFNAAAIQEAIREIQEQAFRADDVDTVVAGKGTASPRTVYGYGGTEVPYNPADVYYSPNKHAPAPATRVV